MNELVDLLKEGIYMTDEVVEAIKSLSNHNWYDLLILFSTILVPIVTAIINVYVVNNNTNKQIANQNKETYRPRLRVNNVEETFGSNNHTMYAYSHNTKESKTVEESFNNSNQLYKKFNITFENIGNGLANELTFYILNHGEKCIGYQSIDSELNQVLNSTIEIQKNSKETITFDICFNKKNIDSEESIEGKDDFIILICNYKDLNGNNYNLMIGIIVKKVENNDNYKKMRIPSESIKFDYYYYQENTKDYNSMIEKSIYKGNYNRIINEINNN